VPRVETAVTRIHDLLAGAATEHPSMLFTDFHCSFSFPCSSPNVSLGKIVEFSGTLYLRILNASCFTVNTCVDIIQGGPIKTAHFLRYHIFAATTDIITRFLPKCSENTAENNK